VSRAAEPPPRYGAHCGGFARRTRSRSRAPGAGPRVSVHERSKRVLDDRGAGIVLQPDTQQLLSERCGLREEQTSVWLRYRQYLGKMERRNFTSSCRNK
jgi:hypothetical protein